MPLQDNLGEQNSVLFLDMNLQLEEAQTMGISLWLLVCFYFPYIFESD
jgi:hypothetical protein